MLPKWDTWGDRAAAFSSGLHRGSTQGNWVRRWLAEIVSRSLASWYGAFSQVRERHPQRSCKRISKAFRVASFSGAQASEKRAVSFPTAIIALAMTGLMYLVVMHAVGNRTIYKATHANVAPVEVPKAIVVLQTNRDDGRFLGVQDIVHVGLSQNRVAHNGKVATATEGHRLISWLSTFDVRQWGLRLGFGWRYPWWNYDLTVVGVGEGLIPKLLEPFIRVIFGSFSGEYFPRQPHLESWRFSIVNQVDVGPHPLTSQNTYARPYIAVPNVGTLFDLKLLATVVNGFASKPSLPESQERVGQYQSSSDLRPSKLSLILGCIFVAFSLVLLSKVVDKINLDPRANDNLCVAGFFGCLVLFCFGGWLIFCWLGLAPLESFGHNVPQLRETVPAVIGLPVKRFTGNALKFFQGSVPVVAKSAETKRVSNDVSIRNLALYYKGAPALVHFSPCFHSHVILGVKITNHMFFPTRPHSWRGDVIGECLRIVRLSEVSKVDLDGDTVRGSFPVIFYPEVVAKHILLDQADIQPRSFSVDEGLGIKRGGISGLLGSERPNSSSFGANRSRLYAFLRDLIISLGQHHPSQGCGGGDFCRSCGTHTDFQPFIHPVSLFSHSEKLQDRNDNLEHSNSGQNSGEQSDPFVRRFITFVVSGIVALCGAWWGTGQIVWRSRSLLGWGVIAVAVIGFAAADLLFFLDGFRWSWGWWWGLLPNGVQSDEDHQDY